MFGINIISSIRRISGLFRVMLFFLLLFSQSLFGQSTLGAEFLSVIAKSNFIFYGTIVYTDSSNINAHSVSKTDIVRVDEVIDAAKSFFNMNGKEITVLRAVNSIDTNGHQLVFYTSGWYYGKTLGVREVNNNLQSAFLPDLKNNILAAREKIKENLLIAQLNRADLVVKARVLETNLDILKNQANRSEHNPIFRAAIIKIQKTIKGKKEARKVLVYYASSGDVMWVDSPKLLKNAEAIFLLHQSKINAAFMPKRYFLLDPRDIQPASQVKKIKKLLK
jgi:hypothetical protein